VGVGTGEDFLADQPSEGAPGLSFSEIAIGFDTQCGVTSNDITWCWGGNLDGAVGNGLPQRTTVIAPQRVIRHPSFTTRVLGPG